MPGARLDPDPGGVQRRSGGSEKAPRRGTRPLLIRITPGAFSRPNQAAGRNLQPPGRRPAPPGQVRLGTAMHAPTVAPELRTRGVVEAAAVVARLQRLRWDQLRGAPAASRLLMALPLVRSREYTMGRRASAAPPGGQFRAWEDQLRCACSVRSDRSQNAINRRQRASGSGHTSG